MNVSDELQYIAQQLTPHFEHVSVRGHGSAAFVFAQHNGRAVEISESENQWWLEFWEISPDEDAAPVKELTVQNSLKAVREANDWLACRDRQAVLPDTDSGIPRGRA